MKMISIKISDELFAEIQKVARSRGETISSVVREALENSFSAKKHQITDPSCLDLAADLAGCLEGTSDLSAKQPKVDKGGE